jgi:hypothetical protein
MLRRIKRHLKEKLVEKFSESETKSQLYEPLNSHDKEIRLVILQQGRFKDTVRCSLSKVSLIDEPSFKHYHIPGATLVSLVKYTSMGILIKLPLIWSPRSDIYDMSLNLESYGLIRHAPLSIDPKENTTETSGSDLYFPRGFVLQAGSAFAHLRRNLACCGSMLT